MRVPLLARESFGLSPLARGTRAHRTQFSDPERFIPAGAGNTPQQPGDSPLTAVYPRWRGEHTFRYTNTTSTSGLSPLARGTRDYWVLVNYGSRFIPAGAGNAISTYILVFIQTVYPRWRGEHSRPVAKFTVSDGLSPLARGTRECQQLLYHLSRFIPAGAGNTLHSSFAARGLPVYPRWRGEHGGFTRVIVPAHGLSPLARGTRTAANTAASSKRFIPAGAGNTASQYICIADRPVYPRWRGEHFPRIGLSTSSYGLSPLARGTRCHHLSCYHSCRFIPAGAGNTPSFQILS